MSETTTFESAELPPLRLCCLDPETPDHTHDADEPSDAALYAPEWAVELARAIAVKGSAPGWAVAIAENQIVMARRQQEMTDTLSAMLRKVDEIGDAVKPTIDAISKHPMAKMFGVGK